ncbi:hypothetical protein EDC01DRAFT_671713 [Geopyxis carbonaria]|nr:hypothetical protein EDC01DRAFT_671713 [Geopyxis carbonaria]
MGANQSASRSRNIPVRPRTPLRFGSVPSAHPVNPYDYNTRPVRNLYQNMQYADSITSILSQESYLAPSSADSAPSPSSSTSSSASPSSSFSAASSASTTPPPQHNQWLCDYPSCAYSVIGYATPEELQLHSYSGTHFALPPQYGDAGSNSWMQPPPPPMRQPSHCACPDCYGNAAAAGPAVYMQQPPMLLTGYNGPEVENLHWQEGQVRPDGAVAKRQRVQW